MKFKIGFVGSASLAIALSGCFSVPQTQTPLAAIPKDQAQSLAVAQPLTPVEICSKPISIPPSQKFELIRCETGLSDKIFILKEDGKEIGRWRASISPHRFDAFEADLDGDGRQELIVANHDGTSNGKGVSYWTIYIVPDPSTHPFRSPLQFQVQEYGRQGTFVRDADRFEIWTTSWEWAKKTDGLVGQQWRYREGELVPTSHPILRRWYSYNFKAERGKTRSDPRIPYLWLASPKVEVYDEQPLLQSAKILSVEDGVGQSINKKCFKAEDNNCREKVEISFNSNLGEPRSYIYANSSFRYLPQEPEERKKYFSYFGDWSSRRIYPISYLPENSEKWLKDRRCKLITYGLTYSRTFKILWLM